MGGLVFVTVRQDLLISHFSRLTPVLLSKGEKKTNSGFLYNRAYLPEKQPSRLETVVALSCVESLHYLLHFEWVIFSFLETSAVSVCGIPNSLSYRVWIDSSSPHCCSTILYSESWVFDLMTAYWKCLLMHITCVYDSSALLLLT